MESCRQSLGVGHKEKAEVFQNVFIPSQSCGTTWSVLTSRPSQQSSSPEKGNIISPARPHILLCSELKTKTSFKSLLILSQGGTCLNPSIREAEVGGSLSSSPAGLQSEF